MEEQVELLVAHRLKYEAPSIESTTYKKSTAHKGYEPEEMLTPLSVVELGPS